MTLLRREGGPVSRNMSKSLETKACTKCGEEKAQEDFALTYRKPEQRRADCKGCAQAVKRAWAQKTQERRKLQKRESYERAKGDPRRLEMRAERRRRYKQSKRGREKRWLQRHRARARKGGATTVDLTLREWRKIREAYKHCCAYCGTSDALTIDHVIPVSKGGDHTAINVVPACHSCNSRKYNKLTLQYVSVLEGNPYVREKYNNVQRLPPRVHLIGG